MTDAELEVRLSRIEASCSMLIRMLHPDGNSSEGMRQVFTGITKNAAVIQEAYDESIASKSAKEEDTNND